MNKQWTKELKTFLSSMLTLAPYSTDISSGTKIRELLA
jgi:hypothetical protein